MIVRNYFYLVVGVLCVLFAASHTLNGLTTTLPVINNAAIDGSTKVVFTYVWHIIGIENLVFGIALLIMSVVKNRSKVKFAAWLIIVILFMRWTVIAYFTLMNNHDSITSLIPDTTAIFVVCILLFLGTRVKARRRVEMSMRSRKRHL
jgi:hypothetical protein